MTKEDYETPSTATLQEDVDEEPGERLLELIN